MVTVLVLLLGLFAFEAIGYGIHRAMHSRWSGPLWRAHMTHHIKLYPPKDVLSDTYRDAGHDSAVARYVLVGVVLGALLLWLLPWVMAVGLMAEMAAIGWLNDYIHDATHIRGVWLERFGWFRRLRELHQVHHRNMRRNLGIVTFLMDHVLGTFRSS